VSECDAARVRSPRADRDRIVDVRVEERGIKTHGVGAHRVDAHVVRPRGNGVPDVDVLADDVTAP